MQMNLAQTGAAIAGIIIVIIILLVVVGLLLWFKNKKCNNSGMHANGVSNGISG